jgi:hypothetical protein
MVDIEVAVIRAPVEEKPAAASDAFPDFAPKAALGRRFSVAQSLPSGACPRDG